MSLAPDSTWHRRRQPLAGALLIFLLVSMFALVDYWLVSANRQALLQEGFDRVADDVVNRLGERLEVYERGLIATRAAVAAAGVEQITRGKFADAFNTLDAKVKFPGAGGFGFVERVAPAEQAAYQRRVQALDWADFSVRQIDSHTGERLVIRFIEPWSENREALGLDVASERNRHEAAYMAMRTGMASLTSPITLVQAQSSPQRSFLFFLPVYGRGSNLGSEDERQGAALGLVYAPLLIDDVIRDLPGLGQTFSMTLRDARQADPSTFFRSEAENLPVSALAPARRQLALYNAQWALELRALPAFARSMGAADASSRTVIFMVVALLAAALTFVVILFAQSRRLLSLQDSRLAAIVSSTSDGIIGMDLQGVITSWNPGAQKIFKMSAQRAIGQYFSLLCVPPAQQSVLSAMSDQALRGNQVPAMLMNCQRGDSVMVSVDVALSPIIDKNARVVGLSATVRELSDQINAWALFERVVDHAPVAMLLVDSTLSVKLCNQRAGELFDLDASGLLGMSCKQLIPDVAIDSYHQSLWRFLAAPPQHGTMIRFDAKTLGQHGRATSVELGLSTIKSGESVMTLISLVDLSDREALELQLSDTLNRMDLAAQASGSGIWVWRADTGLMKWDRLMKALYGDASGSLSESIDYRDWLGYVATEDREDFEQRVADLIEGRMTVPWIYRIVRRDGEVRWLRSSALVEQDLDGNLVQMVGVSSDVTEMIKTQTRMQSMNLALEQRVMQRHADSERVSAELEAFSYAVSHDLRAPLRAIDGYSDILIKSYGNRLDEQGRGFLVKTKAASQRMGILIDDLLMLARITRADIRLQEVDLTALAEQILGELKSVASDRHVEVAIQPGMRVVADGSMMRALLASLLGNAWKFTQNQPLARIEFGQQMRQGRMEFFVRDNGAGFDMAYSDKLFIAFQRLHQANQYPGTGMGLATAHRIVSRHKGAIWGVGEVGQGASFYFWLGDLEVDEEV